MILTSIDEKRALAMAIVTEGVIEVDRAFVARVVRAEIERMYGDKGPPATSAMLRLLRQAEGES
jgi:hypothetical protein